MSLEVYGIESDGDIVQIYQPRSDGSSSTVTTQTPGTATFTATEFTVDPDNMGSLTTLTLNFTTSGTGALAGASNNEIIIKLPSVFEGLTSAITAEVDGN
mmetsp:Transcript_27005/g.4982  ORF Transcript_27005/g.4982 Transcript_27005/m.4982 type:complete len:100 (+) Transcript_27005:4786-5085(+)